MSVLGILILQVSANLLEIRSIPERKKFGYLYSYLSKLLIIFSLLVIVDGYSIWDFYISIAFLLVYSTFLRFINQTGHSSEILRITFTMILLALHFILSNSTYESPDFSEKRVSLTKSPFFEYWHTGSNDVIDGICGAEAILKNAGTEDQFGYVLARERKLQNEVPYTQLFSDRSICNEGIATYVKDPARGQYLALSLFSIVTSIPPSGELIGFFLFLLLIAYFFALSRMYESQVRMSRTHSKIWALVTINMHIFYMSFINGHIGSLMIAPMLPYLVQIIAKKLPIRQIILSSFIPYLFILLVYPYVIPFLAFIHINAIMFNQLNSSNRTQRRFRFALIGTFSIVFLLSSYFALAEARLRVESEFRSWGSFMSGAGLLQFIGILPGNMMGSGVLGNISTLLRKWSIDSNQEYFAISIAILFPLIHLSIRFGTRIPAIWRLVLFSIVFSLFTILTASRDPYYLYKVAYIFQFLFLLCLAFVLGPGTSEVQFSDKTSKVSLRKLYQSVFAIILLANGFWNLSSTVQLRNQNESWKDFKSQIVSMDEKNLANSLSLVEESAPQYISNYLVSQLRGPILNDLSSTIYRFEDKRDSNYSLRGFSLKAMEMDTPRIQVRGIFETEFENGIPFRWVTGSLSKNTVDSNSRREWRGVTVEILNRTRSEKVYSFCASLAPWLQVTSSSLRVRDNEQLLLNTMVSREKKCFEFTLPIGRDSFIIEVYEKGVPPSIFDNRKIVFRLWDESKDTQQNQKIYIY